MFTSFVLTLHHVVALNCTVLYSTVPCAAQAQQPQQAARAVHGADSAGGGLGLGALARSQLPARAARARLQERHEPAPPHRAAPRSGLHQPHARDGVRSCAAPPDLCSILYYSIYSHDVHSLVRCAQPEKLAECISYFLQGLGVGSLPPLLLFTSFNVQHTLPYTCSKDSRQCTTHQQRVNMPVCCAQ